MTIKIDDEDLDVDLGPTGEFPEGKAHPNDEGGLRFAVHGSKAHLVVLQFGTPVKWLALHPEEARKVAAALVEMAGQMERERASKN